MQPDGVSDALDDSLEYYSEPPGQIPYYEQPGFKRPGLIDPPKPEPTPSFPVLPDRFWLGFWLSLGMAVGLIVAVVLLVLGILVLHG